MVRKVLIINDSRSEKLLYNKNQFDSYEVFEVGSHKEAQEIINKEALGIVILNHDLKDKSLIDITKNIRSLEKFIDTPIILTCPDKSKIKETEAFEYGADILLSKSDFSKSINDIIHNFEKKELYSNKKILVIEKQTPIKHVISFTLKKQGFITKCVNKIKTAEEVLKEDFFDIVFIDLDEENIEDIVNFNSLIKKDNNENKRHVPVIIISSKQNKDILKKIMEYGVDDYIIKPFTSKELLIRTLSHLNNNEDIEDEDNDEQKCVLDKDFISSMAHDLRSPMNTIKGTLQLLLKRTEKYGLNETGIKLVNNALFSSENLQIFIDNLAYYLNLVSRSIDSTMKEYYVKDLIIIAKESLSNKLKEKNITVNINSTENISPILVIRREIILLFKNIIENSIYYSDSNSKIDINITKTDDHIKVEIEDEGFGIKDDKIDEVFMPFVKNQSKKLMNTEGNNARKSGLGLAIAKEIIKIHHGKIWIVPNMEKGTKLVLTLPY